MALNSTLRSKVISAAATCNARLVYRDLSCAAEGTEEDRGAYFALHDVRARLVLPQQVECELARAFMSDQRVRTKGGHRHPEQAVLQKEEG